MLANATAAFHRERQKLFDFLGGRLPVRVNDLHQAGEGLLEAGLVTRRYLGLDLELRLVGTSEILSPEVLKDLSDVIDHEAVTTCEKLMADRRDFPAGVIGMHSV